MKRVAALAVLLVPLARPWPAPAAAQEPEPPADPDAPGACTLTWTPIAPGARLLSLREGPEAHVSHVSGRMLWTCGNATMEADSTVKYDAARRVDLIGNVVYRDSIRTLRSRFLTYYEIQDLVIAREQVELVRLVDGSTLVGPRVEFLRAVSGVDAQTTATGRPHMTFYPEGDEPGEPFEVDADRAHFAGEEEARAYGDVVISRSDLRAEADSAYLTRDDGVGILWGSPWVEAEAIRLEGDTIRFRSEDEELREVQALGTAYAVGEAFEVRSERIDVALEAREVEMVWSYGEGLSEALSGDHRLYGDSLRFALHASQIDTAFAVGEAVAVQRDEGSGGLRDAAPTGPEAPADRPDSLPPPTETPVAAEPVGVPSDSPGPAVDSLGVPGDSVGAPTAVAADSSAGPRELMEEVLGSVTGGVTADSLARAAPSDTSGRAGAAARRQREGRVARPLLTVDGTSNWVKGDSLTAVFERPGRPAPSDSAAAPDSAAAVTDLVTVLPPTSAAEEASGLVPSDTAGAAADSASEPRMERLTAIGRAHAFYRQIRDSTATARPSRNYLIGRRIDVLFEAGEPRRVLGLDAIGIYLEPEEAVPDPGAARMRGDSVARPDSARTLPDSLRTLPDSLRTVPDSLRTVPDSLRTAPDSSRTLPDSVRPAPAAARADASSARARGTTAPALTSSGRAPPGTRGHAARHGHVWRRA